MPKSHYLFKFLIVTMALTQGLAINAEVNPKNLESFKSYSLVLNCLNIELEQQRIAQNADDPESISKAQMWVDRGIDLAAELGRVNEVGDDYYLQAASNSLKLKALGEAGFQDYLNKMTLICNELKFDTVPIPR